MTKTGIKKKKLLFYALSEVNTHTRDTQTWQGYPEWQYPDLRNPDQGYPDWRHPDGEGDQNQRYTPPAVDTHVYEYSEQGAQTKVTRLGVPGPVARKGLQRLEDS